LLENGLSSHFRSVFQSFASISSHFQPIDWLENRLGIFSSRTFSGRFWRRLPF
jgi:hypothetical protein